MSQYFLALFFLAKMTESWISFSILGFWIYFRKNNFEKNIACESSFNARRYTVLPRFLISYSSLSIQRFSEFIKNGWRWCVRHIWCGTYVWIRRIRIIHIGVFTPNIIGVKCLCSFRCRKVKRGTMASIKKIFFWIVNLLIFQAVQLGHFNKFLPYVHWSTCWSNVGARKF